MTQLKSWGQPKLQPDGDKWKVLEALKVGDVLIEKGFRFDGGSIHKLLHTLVACPMQLDLVRGFTVHDWLYDQSRKGKRKMSRKEADQLMYDCHIKDGADPILAAAIYKGVRIGASYSWLTPAERAERSRKLEEQVFDGY